MRGSTLACTLAAVLAVGGCSQRAQPRTSPVSPAATAPTALRDTHELLEGTLWVQTSAEYASLAAAAYRNGQRALDEALQDATWTAATEQRHGFESLPPAVILDLDETVFDNSPMQAQLVLDRTVYSRPLWKKWVDRREAGLVPGAKAFLDYAASHGVKVLFVTNRRRGQAADGSDDEEKPTIDNLNALGIIATDDVVLCAGENGWTSDKTDRRAVIAQTHRILLLVGDDLNDFISTGALTPAQRRDLAARYESRWGERWVLIPNPLYGSFDSAAVALPPNTPDGEVLRKKRSVLRGFSN
ncbi:MAG TPA: HAD family acid phosphatase [Vicinamibacterales bacterium]|nr:HAD family acid phosphatase [Vicinamibacterales bacterium]